MSPQAHTAAAKLVVDRLAVTLGTVDAPIAVQLTALDIASLQLTATIGLLHATLGNTR